LKIIYKTEYFGRILFVLEINGKSALVYRSSGLSGTGHGGKILPFMYLNTVNRFRNVLGYIYKEMFFKGVYMPHRKHPEDFPGVKEKLDAVQVFLKDEIAVAVSPDLKDHEPSQEFITAINTELHYYCNKLEMFDWCTDNI